MLEPGFNSGSRSVQGFWTEKNSELEHIVLSPKQKDIANFDGRLRYSPPELATYDTIGITALAFIKSNNYGKQYENDILVGDINDGFLYHFDITKNRTELNLNASLVDRIADEMSQMKTNLLGYGFGRITDIKIGPDGNAYIISLCGTIFRLSFKENL